MSEQTPEYWKEEYENLVVSLMQRSHSPIKDERRNTPRFDFPIEITVGVSGPPINYRISNVSVGGIAIFTDQNIEIGVNLMVNIKDQCTIRAEVVDASIEKKDSPYMDYAYRVRLKYTNESDGYQAFVSFWKND